MTSSIRLTAVLFLCSALLAAPPAAGQRPRTSKSTPPPASAPKGSAPPPERPPQAKVVQYGERDVVTVRSKVRYTTLIVLPANEEILDITCGDKEFWIIDGAQNLAYVKPAKEGTQTNLNLVTASGNIYSFILAEVSGSSNPQPDLKVFIEPKGDSMVASTAGSTKFVSVRELETSRRQTLAAQEETRQVRESAQAAIETGVSRFVTNVRFAYRFEAGRKPFYVRAMYHDERFTYIQARPEETPTLYEIKDGKPNLVSFDYKDGVYVVSKILDRGYLAIGKRRLGFEREE